MKSDNMHDEIKKKFKEGKVIFTGHARRRIDERKILINEIEKVILIGEIIEIYPNDKPYPSCLILGYVRNNEPLYVLCALGELVTIVTVHWFDPEKWINHKTRKE